MRYLVLAACVGCATPTASQRAIAAARATLNDAFARDDAKTTQDLLAPSTTWCFPGARGCISGAEKISSMSASLRRKRPGLSMHFEPSRVEANDAWGWAAEEGRWREQWTEPDGPVVLVGPYFALWQRDAGAWKLVSLSFVASECTGGEYCK
jgi:ketosteroid isomerase-like protein